MNGTWGGIAAGIFGHKAFGAVKDLDFFAQLSGSVIALVYAFLAGLILYFVINKTYGLRMTPEEETQGADLTFHSIEAEPIENR